MLRGQLLAPARLRLKLPSFHYERGTAMTPKQIQLVQDTWRKVEPNADDVATMFYGRLFELEPSYRRLFKGDQKQQGRKLMQMIATAVNGLPKLDTIVPAVEELGRRHVDYRVTEEMYDTVGAALLWTLDKGLGKEFTPPVKDAWTETYTTLADVMKSAAYAPA
jgi:hemoglobin-like flavoprotein